jgi:hypothetical protein
LLHLLPFQEIVIVVKSALAAQVQIRDSRNNEGNISYWKETGETRKGYQLQIRDRKTKKDKSSPEKRQ